MCVLICVCIDISIVCRMEGNALLEIRLLVHYCKCFRLKKMLCYLFSGMQ